MCSLNRLEKIIIRRKLIEMVWAVHTRPERVLA